VPGFLFPEGGGYIYPPLLVFCRSLFASGKILVSVLTQERNRIDSDRLLVFRFHTDRLLVFRFYFYVYFYIY
jgi:hypothetical protein